MVLLPSPNGEYCCHFDLDLYDSPSCQVLATQAARGRHLQVLSPVESDRPLEVRLCEDGYVAWLPPHRLPALEPAPTKYRAASLGRSEIAKRLPDVIAFARAAMEQPNYYLWGGTLGPNYDCSGLVQGAFAASGIWLPRDSYLQEAFTEKVSFDDLLPGDLIFFATKKVDHVAIYLGGGSYLHSSGKEMGRNGIGCDRLSGEGDAISRAYAEKMWGFGRVMSSYQTG